MQRLTISATSHALNYLPAYLADSDGLFARRGLDVELIARDPWTGVLDDLAADSAEVALGGLWVPAMYAGTATQFTTFAQLNHQFPKALVVRTDALVGEFAWTDMEGTTILAPGIGGSAPYAFTAGLMREAGADPRSVTFLRDLSTPMFLDLFRGGLGDAIVLDLPNALAAQRRGDGHIAVDYTVSGGLGPNSVFYCRKDRFDELVPALGAFVDAIGEAMDLLATALVEDLRPLMAERWPTADPAHLAQSCARLQASQTWDTPRIDAAATDRWLRILFDERMIRKPLAYGDLIDESALAVSAAHPVR
ncbi:ABC transporter substrate-binding protein [Gordonia sp. L191]|uniref:ABC transporter substrate-binding protein n=1 Tax=Gordonia sp. L191 TaxID=2982699 RepID=UPI0024C0C01D|nr:ABC transporter substrate-binding protein [Gordonia sp. L191]WHU46402.1 ABC transporter substrate-binding protein [Gordonia sp. L191]